MGKVRAVCISEKKGTAKRNVGSSLFIPEHGLENDAHADKWHRQVSLLSYEKVEAFRQSGGHVEDGDFGENLLVDGIDFPKLPVGTKLRSGDVLLEITQIGKKCHDRCAIYYQVGDCIMPKEGIFAKVLKGGTISVGDELTVEESAYRVAVITASDKGAAGQREDQSGVLIKELVTAEGYKVVSYQLLSDEQSGLEEAMIRICDEGIADMILTTGGTGLSPRDNMPEATLAIAEKLVPGIAEVMRNESMKKTNRAMLSRAVSAIRGRTLIINLPGSTKAVRESLESILPALSHGLDILTDHDRECGGNS